MIGIPSFLRRLQTFFIGDLLLEKGYYEQARIRLIYNLTVILLLLMTSITIQLVIRGLFINAVITATATFGMVIVLLLLKYRSAVGFAAKFHVIMGMVLLVFSCLAPLDSIIITNEIWFVVQILFTFFILGRAWAIGVAIVAVVVMMYYVNFLMHNNLHNELVYERYKIQALLFILPIEFFLIYYMISRFLNTRDYAEKQVSQANEELLVRNQIIEKQKNEKAAMIMEIHHRVKNNLQIISSLLRLQANEVEDKKVSQMFEESQKRVVSMALLHENLYKSDDVTQINAAEHLNALAFDLIDTYSVGKLIDLDLKIEDLHIGIKTMVPLGLIINESVTNSLKYGFPDRDEGTIFLHLTRLKDGSYELIIGDNGVGMENGKSSGSNLGRELIAVFVEQLEGVSERLDEEGTLHRIVFQSIDTH